MNERMLVLYPLLKFIWKTRASLGPGGYLDMHTRFVTKSKVISHQWIRFLVRKDGLFQSGGDPLSINFYAQSFFIVGHFTSKRKNTFRKMYWSFRKTTLHPLTINQTSKL
jgi:hypothetical protein